MTTININNLSKEQLEDLEKQIAEAKKVLTTSYGRKRVEEGERYYYIDWNGNINFLKEDIDEVDMTRFTIGNYYLTQKEAEQARDRQLAIIRVNDAIDKLNEGWEHNNEEQRYIIAYSDNDYRIDYYSIVGYICPLVINFCKSEEIAQQIISEYKNDLNLIFNIK